MRIADWELQPLETGSLRLDGGAMFGTVPKALWSRHYPSDESNRIEVALRCLLLRNSERVVVVDTGVGDKWTEDERRIYGIGPDAPGLLGSLDEAGVGPDDVTDVILTHLHFDHAGGATRKNLAGRTVATFPRARHWLQRGNLEQAKNPGPRERVSYRSEDFEALVDGGQIELLDGPARPFGGIELIVSDGHTRGLQVVRLIGEGGGLLYAADLVPTVAHLSVAWTMGYDIHAGLLVDEKSALLGQCAATGVAVFFEHELDGGHAAARLVENKRGYEPAEYLEF